MDDVQRLILEEVQGIRRELGQHIKEESQEFASIRRDISQLKLDSALNKQKLGLFSAGISAFVAAIWALFTTWFGR